MNAKVTGDFIAKLRKEKGLTQKQLSEKLNVSDKAISRWETGRGYPDIDSLLALSKEFSVSINELLCGYKIVTKTEVSDAQIDIADSFIKTVVKKTQFRFISVVLTVILFVLIFNIAFWGFPTFYENVMGSPTCVISADYSAINILGQRYVPLVLDGVECKTSECLINEAQVENADFIGKLLFSDSIYSVKQCKNNEIVYLQTDYDLNVSDYYCLEGKVEEYINISKELFYDVISAEIITKDWNYYDLTLDNTLTEIINNSLYARSNSVNCEWSREKGDESITLYSSQSSGPFRKAIGEFIRKKDKYYYFDYSDIPITQDNGDYSDIYAYEIDKQYKNNFDSLFSYMFK